MLKVAKYYLKLQKKSFGDKMAQSYGFLFCFGSHGF